MKARVARRRRPGDDERRGQYSTVVPAETVSAVSYLITVPVESR